MVDVHGDRAAHEYLWFALLLMVVLVTSTVYSPSQATVSARNSVVTP
jgi:hypothetical protein